jgi:hypothetical protein
MIELVQIFVTLGATSIKYVRYDSGEESKNMRLDFGLSDFFPQFTLSEGVRLTNDNMERTGVEYEIRLRPSEVVDTDTFSQPSFYYLKREPAWREMVSRRTEGGVIYDKYTYWNKEMKLLKGKFIQQLKCLNLSVEYDWKKYNDFMVDYEVTYS